MGWNLEENIGARNEQEEQKNSNPKLTEPLIPGTDHESHSILAHNHPTAQGLPPLQSLQRAIPAPDLRPPAPTSTHPDQTSRCPARPGKKEA